jgi:translation initiation factor IF-2
LQKDKVRVYTLARELNMESKDLLDLCREAGFENVKNQLSNLTPEQREVLVQMTKKGGGAVAVAAPPKPVGPPVPPVVTSKVRNLDALRSRREGEPPSRGASPIASPTPVEPAKVEPPPAPAVQPTPPPARQPAPNVAQVPPPAEIKPAAPSPPPVPPPAAARASEPPPSVPSPAAPLKPSESGARVPDLTAMKPPDLGGSRVRDLNQPRPPLADAGKSRPKREPPRPTLARPMIATPPPLKPRPPKDLKEQAQKPIAQQPIARPPELKRGEPINIQDLLKKPIPGGDLVVPPLDVDDELDPKNLKKKPGSVAGRDARHAARATRAKDRKGRENEPKGTRQLLDDSERERHRKTSRNLDKLRRKQTPGTQPRKGKVPISLPITVRSLSEATAVRAAELLFKLRDHGLPPTVNINTVLDPELAELIAADLGCELDIKKPVDLEEQILRQDEPDRPEDLVPRAPVVTIMGHVDHGKTSLLDKIRQSNVAATEAGGITQVIRAWRVEHGGRPITFLDTPGHEAFTKMRARGAQVTDIAVIVVAADDGVMPQTEEAISHARAAGVPIVVAINKVDLPNANLNKTRQQLYGLSLIPDTMGGDTPFVETSAATGKGIPELLDMLSLVAELKELKANPKKPGRGTCLEAMLDEGEGVRATLLVREGTLRKGDVVLCGASYGRVRAMYDDLGRPIAEAGPSFPVRITGLNSVPNADDPFQVVEDLALARDIAEKRAAKLQEAAKVRREPVLLESLTQAKVTELKVILKCDFRGSVEAIRKELEKLQHEEVRVRVLEAAIGAITENDVWLALTSPGDTLIVGFNVVADDRARALAEEKGIPIRLYDIIYNLTDDVKAALQGKLKPREEVIHLGRAVVRETFKISRVGTIAGCYVTSGVIERSAKVRLIREGVVIYPPPDRTAGLESLKRFKEDAREVREGFECGIKIAGYDDVKVGDVIEAFRVEQIQRTL